MKIQQLFHHYLNFVKRYIPEPKVESSVGIDIGLSTCKMVEIKPKGSTFELVQWGVEPFQNGDPVGAIKTLLAKTENPMRPPATSVHGKGTLIRYVDLPRMNLEDLRRSFVYEADKYLPFTANQIYLDCMILDPKMRDNKMSVMVAAAKREIVDERINLLKNAGFQADFVTLNSIAMANVINTAGVPAVFAEENAKGEALAVVDIGEKVTNITILLNRLPRFTRDIFIGGEDFTRHLANTLKISVEEAEKLKRNPGIQKDVVAKNCEAVALNLISDMRLSFDYFVTEHNISISKILLSGGASLFDGMVDLFSHYLETSIAAWDPFEYIEVSEEKSEELKKISGQLGVALGLALYT